jgi:hypothetical protein
MRNVTEIQRELIRLKYLAPLNAEGKPNDDGRFGALSLGAYNRFLASKGRPPVEKVSMAQLNADLFPEEQPAALPPKTNPLQDWLIGLAIKQAVSKLKGSPMLNVFTNGKTYIIGALMILIGLAEMFGIDIPRVDGTNASQIIAEGFGFIFLRAGVAKLGK